METTFYILLSLKTLRGFEIYGQYFLGDHKESATALFAQFKGSVDIDDPLLLHIDLMETTDEFPEKINTICCTLDELSHNVKLITREIFRLKTLKEL
ncbi:MAG TPA: hypothetical protein VGN20_18860 [Mucilaginibacter sp.]|jgi:hypothetical protein